MRIIRKLLNNKDTKRIEKVVSEITKYDISYFNYKTNGFNVFGPVVEAKVGIITWSGVFEIHSFDLGSKIQFEGIIRLRISEASVNTYDMNVHVFIDNNKVNLIDEHRNSKTVKASTTFKKLLGEQIKKTINLK